MSPNLPSRARLYEFAVAAALVGGGSLFLLDVLSEVQEEVERLTVESTIRNMNSGLNLRQAELMITGREAELPALARINPVEWLQTPPDGYAAGAACRPAEGPAPGQWCWDPATHELSYRPRRADGLKFERDVPWLTWRVEAPTEPRFVRPGTIRVAAVGVYRWRPMD